MQRARSSTTLFLSALLAMAIAFVAAAPADAAPSRANGRGKVIFVHGFDPWGPAATNCNEYWSSAISYFKSKGYTDSQLRTYSYYANEGGSNGCTWRYKDSRGHYGTRGTSLTDIARSFANRVYNSYSSGPYGGQKVDVVAHSMGGLVVRAALYHVKRGTSGFPPYLYIEDVVTLGTPHNGADSAQLALCNANYFSPTQCKQMARGSTFLDGLPLTPSQSAMGTDWTVASSYDDDTVSESSGVWINAQHKIQYDGSGNDAISHSALKSRTYGEIRARVKNGGSWSSFAPRSSPVRKAYLGVYYKSTH